MGLFAFLLELLIHFLEFHSNLNQMNQLIHFDWIIILLEIGKIKKIQLTQEFIKIIQLTVFLKSVEILDVDHLNFLVTILIELEGW